MTRQSFINSLEWVEGMPPTDCPDDKYLSEKFLKDGLSPMVVRTADGIFVLGDANLLFGSCDCHSIMDRKDILSYAYLWSDNDQTKLS